MNRLVLFLLVVCACSGCQALSLVETGETKMTARTALLVLDLQNDFCHPDGKLHELVRTQIDRQDVVNRALKLIQAARDRDVLTFVCPILFDYSKPGGATPEGIAAPIVEHQAFDRADFGGELIADLEPYSDSFVRLEKPALSAFVGTDLHERLKAAGVSRVVIAGLLTNFCVESTARDAFDHGFQVRVVRDATATFSDEQQAYAEETIFPMLGKVITVEQFVSGRID